MLEQPAHPALTVAEGIGVYLPTKDDGDIGGSFVYEVLGAIGAHPHWERDVEHEPV